MLGYLLQHHKPKMQAGNKVWMAPGTATEILNHRRTTFVHDFAHSIGSIICEVLPSARCLTGFDTISSLFGIRNT